MSYDIVYDRQFIKSAHGITPCILSGPSNVYTGSGRNMKRDRSWSVFYNVLGTSEEGLLSLIQHSLGAPYQEHWMQNGKWVDDAGLIRWIKNGCAKAASLEDVLAVNHDRYAKCFVSLWQRNEKGFPDDSIVLEENISTTEELDAWIDRVHSIKEELHLTDGYTAYPIIRLSYDTPIRHPDTKQTDPDEEVLVKISGMGYLTSYTDGHIGCMQDVSQALVMTRGEAAMIEKRIYPRTIRLVDPKLKETYQPHIIQFSNGKYLNKVTRNGIWTTPYRDAAKVYPNQKAAEKALAGRMVTACCSKGKYEGSVIPIN